MRGLRYSSSIDRRRSIPRIQCSRGIHCRAQCLVSPDYQMEVFQTSDVKRCLRSMSRDPSIYPEPEEFLPERYEGMDAETAKLTDPRKFVFGFGRRVCPGRHLAELSIWLAVANILATLNIRKSRDVAGREITPSISYTTGFASHSEEFPCDIWPRTSILTDSAAHSG